MQVVKVYAECATKGISKTPGPAINLIWGRQRLQVELMAQL